MSFKTLDRIMMAVVAVALMSIGAGLFYANSMRNERHTKACESLGMTPMTAYGGARYCLDSGQRVYRPNGLD